MGRLKSKRELYRFYRQLAGCLFLLGIYFGAAQTAAAQTLTPLVQKSEIPTETWIMISVVAAALLFLAVLLYRHRPSANNEP